jgi:hypothetical protein
MTEAQIQLLRRMADQGRIADMDIGIGANVLAGVLDEIERLRLAARRAEGNERLAAMVQEMSVELEALRARAERAEAALSILIHDAAGGQVIVPADSLNDARPLDWYTHGDGDIEITVVYE